VGNLKGSTMCIGQSIISASTLRRTTLVERSLHTMESARTAGHSRLTEMTESCMSQRQPIGSMSTGALPDGGSASQLMIIRDRLQAALLSAGIPPQWSRWTLLHITPIRAGEAQTAR